MTDNEIIKALENIINEKIGCCAEDCAFYDGKVHSCAQTIAKHSLDLINRQKAEKETMQSYIDCLKTENERLESHTEMYHELRAEAIKELFNDETILSLRAVLHGCGTNNKCKCGYFAYDIKNGANFPMISFEQAITNVAKLIVELTEKR